MQQTMSNRRKAENEVVYRQYNERMQQGIETLNRMADHDGYPDMKYEDDTPLHFYCECSDENCQQRVPMRPSEYESIHKDRGRFIMISGHETKSIEKSVKKQDAYTVVEKFVMPPEHVDTLHKTDVNNT